MDDRTDDWHSLSSFVSPPPSPNIWEWDSPTPDFTSKQDVLPAEPPDWAQEGFLAMARQHTGYENSISRIRNSMMKSEDYIEVIRKEEPGLGAIPDFAPSVYRMPYWRQTPMVGSSPFEYQLEYPKTIKALAQIGADLILDLSVFYNDTFLIQPGDSLEIQRCKLARFMGLAETPQ